MKKTLKILFISVFAFILFSIGQSVEANSIQSISMDIFIDDKGDAHITETWKCNVTQGTEVYHPYYNLGKSDIKDLRVSEGNTKYTTLSKWDTSGTLTSKANKCGINKIFNGVELCWGISKYGSHTYIAKYTITNFVSETKDAQMIYWTLIPYDFSTSIGNMDIKIHAGFKIKDTIDVWGYGNYGGTAYVHNGNIEMHSDGRLATDEYMTILVKFPLGTFHATNKLRENFEYYYNMAEKGAVKYTKAYSNDLIFSYTVLTIMLVFFIYVSIHIGMQFREAGEKDCKIKYGSAGKRISKDVPYVRDIPCQKNIFRAYFIGYQYNIIEKKTDLLGAMLLKWTKDGLITIEEKKTGFIFKKENIVIVFKEKNPEMMLESKEVELFEMLHTASRDGCLESKEFERWCKNNHSKILTWFDQIIYREINKLFEEGLIKKVEKDPKRLKGKYLEATPELKQEALELAGLKRYLKENTLIKDRESIEVNLFEEYMIFAQIMGISEKVAKQFKDIYPEIITESNFVSYEYIMHINMSSRIGLSVAISASRMDKIMADNYSSGGGGYSSGGGGGGSFGGGGGGRRFPLKFIYHVTRRTELMVKS